MVENSKIYFLTHLHSTTNATYFFAFTVRQFFPFCFHLSCILETKKKSKQHQTMKCHDEHRVLTIDNSDHDEQFFWFVRMIAARNDRME